MATHRFTPTVYHRTLGTHEPVLRVSDGDSIITTTLDCIGRDEKNKEAAIAGNPMTGPFYLEGAKPGDTLAVKFDSIVPSRRQGMSGAVLSPNAVAPRDVTELPKPKDRPWIMAEWELDAVKGTATLKSPETMLGNFVLPIKPMLGSFGVAPERGQAISAVSSGSHGGNMDYVGFTSGVTVYLPVAVEGALFFLGDGHALQSDGEISVTGIEISMNVQFTLSLKKGKPISWPRGENDEFIFTVGNSCPLDRCIQYATGEMLRWLQDEYKLDALSANLLMSQCAKYDLGNIYDPASTMVCKMPKIYLPKI
jgi:amidase